MESTDAPAGRRVTDPADECYRCGYALHGIADEQPCPECGLVALRSRRPSDELHDTRPRWLRRVGLGAGLMLLAVLSVPAWPLGWAAAEACAPAPRTSPFAFELWRTARSWAAFELSALAFLVGVLLLTSREGYPPADRADRRRRLSLRLAAAAPLAVMPVADINFDLRWTFSGEGGRAADVLVFAAATVGCVPLPLLLFGHLRNVAARARRPRLAEQCAVVGVGAALTLVGTAALTVVFREPTRFGLGDDWPFRSDVAFLLALALYVAGALFPLWSVCLLASFAATFGRAARRLRREWQRNDRVLAIRA